MACEWNPAAVEALKKSLVLNKCVNKCEILEGDNRLVRFNYVAHLKVNQAVIIYLFTDMSNKLC